MHRSTLVALILGAQLVHAAPPPTSESAKGRQAVRGAPVEAGQESEQLRALREFEAQSFARDEAQAPRAASIGPEAIPAEHAWLEGLKLPDLPVRFDPRVVRYLEFYKHDPRGRAIMASWLKAQGRYQGLIKRALERAKLPAGLLYVAMIESGFNPHDRSHKGAVGLWQFMPAGGAIYGLRIDFWVDERKDPEKATDAAMRYLGDLKVRFGSWPLALAAYNAGYGAVLRAMQKYNTNDYFELCRHEDGLPWDTLLYVPKVMATAIVGENRAAFGYDVAPDPALGYERVAVAGGTSLASVARAAGVPAADVEALNPELRRRRTPPDVASWQVRVPPGTAVKTVAALAGEREPIKPYVVRFGEGVDEIARAHGMTARELRTLNGVEDAAELRPGLTLVVAEGRAPRDPGPAPCEAVLVAVPDKEAVVAGRRRVFYRTLPHDSTDEIAAFFKVKPADLARWNNLDLSAKLVPGLVLQLWVPSDFDTSKVALVDNAIVRVVTTGSDEFFDLVEARRGRTRLQYSVKKGDDLAKIGKKFGLSVADLERINRFGAKQTRLTVGKKLTVYREMTADEKARAACSVAPGGLVAPSEPPEMDPGLDEEAPPPQPVALPRLPALPPDR